MEVFELTPEQKKKLSNLKRAISECRKAKIGFFSILDYTYAFNKQYVVGVRPMDICVEYMPENGIKCSTHGYPKNYFDSIGGDSLADDQSTQYILLTEKGKKLFEKEQNED